MKQAGPDVGQEKPKYIKPQVVASYTKEELKEEFKELRGQTGFTDAFIVDFKG